MKYQLTMKYKVLMVLLLFHFGGFAQIKIKLLLPDRHEDNYEYDYQFVNKSDSIYVKVYHSSDMGHAYGRTYELKRDLPSGDYEVYINDVIHSKVEIDLAKKQMRKTIFNANGVIKEIRHHEYDLFVKQDLFDENGNYSHSIEPKN